MYGVYGPKGVPSPSNVPGSRVGAVSWIDNSGNLWLFGGLGKAAPGSGGMLLYIPALDGIIGRLVSALADTCFQHSVD